MNVDKNWLSDKADELATENELLTEQVAVLHDELAQAEAALVVERAQVAAFRRRIEELTRETKMARKGTEARGIEEEHERFYSGLMAIINNPTMPRDHVQSQILGLVQGTQRWRRDG